jgi:hypothetical protein
MSGRFTMDVIATCAFATKTNSHKDPNNPFIINAKNIFNLKASKVIPALIFPSFLLKILNIKSVNDVNSSNFFLDLMRHILKTRRNNKVKYNDLNFVNKRLTEDEIVAQGWVFMIAGYETTATTLSFCSYELALNPECQEKLFEEINSAIDSNGEISYETLVKLPYLDSVISETIKALSTNY